MIAKEKKKKSVEIETEQEEVLDGQPIPTEEIEESFISEEEEMPADRRDPRFSTFKVKKIIVQGGQRQLHIEIMKTFKPIYLDYVVELTPDLDTLDWRIEEKKKSKQNYENQNQMEAFDEFKKRELEEYDHVIENLVTERAERIDRSPKISFEASIIDFAKKPNSTDLVLVIPSDAVGSLNEYYNFMENYKIELIKNLNNE